MWRGTPLEVEGDNHFHAPIYVRQWDIVVLDRHLMLLVLAELVICFGYICVCLVLDRHLVCFSACCTVAICEVGCLARTRCKRGMALVKFQTFPISCGVTGHVCSLWDMYA